MIEHSCMLNEISEHFCLKCLTEDVDYSKVEITNRNVNRPGIQLTGFFELFDSERIQIMGWVENAYLERLDSDIKIKTYDSLFKLGAPCYIFCRDIIPDENLLESARRNNMPIFSTPDITSDFMSAIIGWLGERLAPSITIHGCLVDINGVGVFIQGESGIGKSEAVLELVKRGHRMVADDVVEICKASEKTLFGKAPAIVKDYLEIRGIGIVDIKNLFGVQAIKETQTIELVATLKEWNAKDEYDRVGDKVEYTEILGNKLINYRIPVRPGRNLAVILEAVALNYRTRQMGYDDGKEFMKRINGNFK